MTKLSNARCLVDTNILVPLVVGGHKYRDKVLDFVEESKESSLSFVISTQNILELSAVLTRAFKIPSNRVAESLRYLVADPLFEVIYPNPQVVEVFLGMIVNKPNVHVVDLFLAATALVYGVDIIITDDVGFLDITGLRCYNPFT